MHDTEILSMWFKNLLTIPVDHPVWQPDVEIECQNVDELGSVSECCADVVSRVVFDKIGIRIYWNCVLVFGY